MKQFIVSAAAIEKTENRYVRQNFLAIKLSLGRPGPTIVRPPYKVIKKRPTTQKIIPV